jgi:hypothetical protein
MTNETIPQTQTKTEPVKAEGDTTAVVTRSPEQIAADKATDEAAKAEKAAADKAVKDAEKAAKAATAAAAKEAKTKEKADAKAAKDLEKETAKKAKEDEKAAKLAAKEAAKPAKVQMPEQNGVRRPKPEGLCGQAWTLADDLSRQLGQPVPIANLLEASKVKGLNEGNVRAEYARWRKFNGVTGRVSLPVVAAAPAAQQATA